MKFDSKLKSFISLAALSTLCVQSVNATVQEEGIGFAYGKDHAYILKAPPGWILDTEAGAQQGVFAVFYPRGSSWSDGLAVMYSNAAGREGLTPDKAIERDVASLKGKSPGLHVIDGGTLITTDGKKALIRYFTGDSFGNFEAVGYVVEKNIVANIVLSARNKQVYDGALMPFRQLVSSYHFVADDPSKIDPQVVLKDAGAEKPRPSGKTMTKVIVHAIDHADSGTQTIWRSGIDYMRFDVSKDPKMDNRTLSLSSGTVFWVFNHVNHTAQHVVDSGPIVGARLPIFGEFFPGQDSPVHDLEYGNEFDFFKRYVSDPSQGPVIDGQPTDQYKVTLDGATLTMLTHKGSQKPWRVSIDKGDKHETLEYVSFETDLPFQKELFALPDGFKVVEAEHSAAGK